MVNVPKDFQDYDDDDPDINRRNRRMHYWSVLKNLKEEFLLETNSRDPQQYTLWLETKYGFKPRINNEGYFTDDYEIIDEKKYMIYVLKYGN
jgi:hypothetical protein